MMLGLKSRIISKFLQSKKLKQPFELNLQEIHQRIEDGISFRRVTRNTPYYKSLEVLEFQPGFLKHTSFDCLRNARTNNSPGTICFHEAPNVLAEAVLSDIHEQAENYGINHALEFKKYFNGKSFVNIPKNENVVVEFRNQYVGTPFHVGHLRSIMIGKFITNISKLFNKKVTFVNHVLDWTQMMGVMADKRHGIPHEYKKEEINYLVDAFEELGENDVRRSYEGSKIYKQVLAFMNSLEEGDQKALEIWQKCRDVCVNGHEKILQKLGIKFDATTAESQCIENIKKILSVAKEKNLLRVDEKTGVQYFDVTYPHKKIRSTEVVNKDRIIYATRDIAAILDRFDTYSPDRIIYVRDACKSYFYLVKTIVKMLRSYQPGRIELAKTVLKENQDKDTPLIDILNTLIPYEDAMLCHYLWEDGESFCNVSEKLTMCKFAVHNLKKRRYKECFYEPRFNFEESFGGSEGADLQFTHARLCRMIKLYNDDYSFKSVDFNLLSDDCAIRLIQHLAGYPDVLIKSYMELESCHLVHYLITLAKLEHLASKELSAFNQPKDIRDARFTLFKCTRQVLANGMNILGIQPVGKI